MILATSTPIPISLYLGSRLIMDVKLKFSNFKFYRSIRFTINIFGYGISLVLKKIRDYNISETIENQIGEWKITTLLEIASTKKRRSERLKFYTCFTTWWNEMAFLNRFVYLKIALSENYRDWMIVENYKWYS